MKKLLYLSFCVLAISCSLSSKKIEKNKATKVIAVKQKDIVTDKKLSELITVNKVIPLEYNERSKLGQISSVSIIDDRIYVLDNVIANALFCFNIKGEFINRFKKAGKGPNEYLRLNDLSIVGTDIYVSAMPSKIYKLNRNLEIIETISVKDNNQLGLNLDHIIALNDDTILISNNTSKHRFHYLKMKSGKFISKLSPSLGKFDDLTVSPPFTKLNDGTIIGTRGYVDTIYHLTPSALHPYAIIDYEFPIPLSLKKELRQTYFLKRKHNKEYMYGLDDYWECENFISFNFKFNRSIHFFMMDKIKNETVIFKHDIFNNIFGSKYFPLNVHGHYKNNIIISIMPHELLDDKGKIKANVSENVKMHVSQGLNEEDNPLLILYQPKFRIE